MAQKQYPKKVIWISPLYHSLLKMIVDELNCSAKEFIENLMEEHAGKHPELMNVWEKFQYMKKDHYSNESE